jgi:hypothetical protein
MTAHLALVLACTMQDAPPASAPSASPAASRPSAIRVGDSLEIPLAGLPEGGIALRLDLAATEPLTLMAECCDADVGLRVEEVVGALLASDDDSGIETNAHLLWRPSSPGAHVVRLLVKEPAAGSVRLRVLRGALSPEAPEAKLASLAFWDIAWDRARRRSDGARADLVS